MVPLLLALVALWNLWIISCGDVLALPVLIDANLQNTLKWRYHAISNTKPVHFKLVPESSCEGVTASKQVARESMEFWLNTGDYSWMCSWSCKWAEPRPPIAPKGNTSGRLQRKARDWQTLAGSKGSCKGSSQATYGCMLQLSVHSYGSKPFLLMLVGLPVTD